MVGVLSNLSYIRKTHSLASSLPTLSALFFCLLLTEIYFCRRAGEQSACMLRLSRSCKHTLQSSKTLHIPACVVLDAPAPYLSEKFRRVREKLNLSNIFAKYEE